MYIRTIKILTELFYSFGPVCLFKQVCQPYKNIMHSSIGREIDYHFFSIIIIVNYFSKYIYIAK